MDRNEEEKISLVETRKPTKNGVEGKHSKVGQMLGCKPPKNKKALEIKGSLVLLAETKGFILSSKYAVSTSIKVYQTATNFIVFQ